MEVKASLKYLRMSPRKVRLTANLIKGLDVKEAEYQLKSSNKRPSPEILKLLKSAVKNAEHNFNLSYDNLFVYQIKVDQGPTLVRYMPRARGVANEIRKRSSHITLILKEKSPSAKKEEKKEEISEKEEKTKETILKETKKERKAGVKEETKKERVKTPVLARQRVFRRKAI